MTTEQLVRAARNPQEAMLAIAAALDRIEAGIGDIPPHPAPDPWLAGWSEGPPVSAAVVAAATPGLPIAFETVTRAQHKQDEIAVVEQLLVTTADAEDRRALEAKLRLLKDEGAAIIRHEQGTRVQSIDGGSELTVEIPPASPERQAYRRRFAEQLNLYEALTVKGVTPDEFLDAYAKGGPMWLYLGDRDAIMTLPYGARVAMIEDIEQDAPVQAQEVGRDLLMERGVEGTESVERIYGE